MKFTFNIDKIEGGQASLNDSSGTIVSWPASKLPPNAKTGDKISFHLGDEEDLAKKILNEILG